MLRFQQLIQLALLTVGLIICGPAAAQQNPTLADVLKREAIPYPRTTVLHLNSRITSYATLNDAQEFLIPIISIIHKTNYASHYS
jgi:hypothetical protein